MSRDRKPATNYPNVKSFEKRMGTLSILARASREASPSSWNRLPARRACKRPPRPWPDCNRASRLKSLPSPTRGGRRRNSAFLQEELSDPCDPYPFADCGGPAGPRPPLLLLPVSLSRCPRPGAHGRRPAGTDRAGGLGGEHPLHRSAAGRNGNACRGRLPRNPHGLLLGGHGTRQGPVRFQRLRPPPVGAGQASNPRDVHL